MARGKIPPKGGSTHGRHHAPNEPGNESNQHGSPGRKPDPGPIVGHLAERPRHFPDSAALCKWVAGVSDGACILSFSAGKDSIAAWLQLRRYFPRIVPFHMYLVPGLEFVEEGLAYFERFFGVPVIRMPHPSLFRWFGNLVFQPPEHCLTIEQADLPRFDYPDVEGAVRAKVGLPGAYVAVGSRAADSPIRRSSISQHGPIQHDRRSFLAVYDWVIADVIRELAAAKVRLPVDYTMFGRTFDGLDYRFLKPIAERYPRDYAKILEWFPLADLEIFRRERVGR